MSLGNSTNCNMPCLGNANQTCGGALALDVYEVTDRYWSVPDYESPWDAPKPAPVPAPASVNLLTGAYQGAATRAAQSGTAAAGALSRLEVAAVLFVGWLLVH
jgi:hypothetical protein